jgi:hypothetical protein
LRTYLMDQCQLTQVKGFMFRIEYTFCCMVFQLTIIVAHVGLEIAYMQVAIAGYYQKHVAFLSEFNLVGKFA